MLPHIFYERYSSRLACYALLVSINYLISKRKQHILRCVLEVVKYENEKPVSRISPLN